MCLISTRLAFFVLAALSCVSSANLFAQTAKIYESSGIQGYSQPFRTSVVAADQSGLLRAIEIKPGDEVQQDQPLARIDDTIARARLHQSLLASQAMGEIEMAESQLAARQDRLERIRGLRSRGHATPIELQQAEVDVKTALASLQRAQEAIAQAAAEHGRLELELAKYVVHAPFAGVVLELKKELGEYVGPTEPAICVLAELDRLSVDFLVSRETRERITNGQLLSITFLEEGQQVVGKVYYISPFPHGETGTFSVRIEVENKSRKLMAGERCLLDLDDLKSPRAAALDMSRRAQASDEFTEAN